MDTGFVVDRIYGLCVDKGYKKKHLCDLLGVRPSYFTDCRSKNLNIPDDVLKSAARILGTSVEYLTGETNDPDFRLSSIGMKTIPYNNEGARPVYGHASAGLGVLAEQEILGYETVSPEYDREDFFWLQVDGDSMSPIISDHDLVLVEKDAPLESNTIMVVIVDDDDGFVKKVYIDEDTITLSSYNPEYRPMVFGGSDIARLRFIGRVVELKRKF
jgi:repressor LexA